MIDPKVFISYSWAPADHKDWVNRLAERLRSDRVHVTLDQSHAVAGVSLTAFMERAIKNTDFVLIICTPEYKERADKREGAVGYEAGIIAAKSLLKKNERKFIPILCSGEWHDAAPDFLADKICIDMRSEIEEFGLGYVQLLATIRGEQQPGQAIPEISLAREKSTERRYYHRLVFIAVVACLAIFFVPRIPTTDDPDLRGAAPDASVEAQLTNGYVAAGTVLILAVLLGVITYGRMRMLSNISPPVALRHLIVTGTAIVVCMFAIALDYQALGWMLSKHFIDLSHPRYSWRLGAAIGALGVGFAYFSAFVYTSTRRGSERG